MKFSQILIAAAVVAASSANAMQVASYSWEDGQTVITDYNSEGMNYTNIQDAAARTGDRFLLVEDLEHSSGTPNATVAWVSGLSDGDTVNASFWVKDDSAGAAPSARIWSHYTRDNNVDAYAGSYNQNNPYSAGNGWEQLTASYTFDSDNNSRDGLAIELRFYDSNSTPTGFLLVDDIMVEVSSDTASIAFAGEAVSEVPVPAAVWLFGTALLGLAGVKRR